MNVQARAAGPSPLICSRHSDGPNDDARNNGQAPAMTRTQYILAPAAQRLGLQLKNDQQKRVVLVALLFLNSKMVELTIASFWKGFVFWGFV